MDLTWAQTATDFAVSGGLSAVAYGATAFTVACAYTAVAAPIVGTALVAVGATTAAAPVVGAVVVGAGSAVAGHYVYEWVLDETKQRFYVERPMDAWAEFAGHLVGSIVGGSVGVHYGVKAGQAIRFAWQYPNYVTYEAEARSLTERTYRANRQTIDPGGLRGPAWHLDHKISVRQGYALRLPTAEIAAAENLSMVTALQNLSWGAKLGPVPYSPPMWSLWPVTAVAR